jgi:Flp pilus assembly protein TadG
MTRIGLPRAHPAAARKAVNPASDGSSLWARVARGEDIVNTNLRNSRGAAITELALVLPMFLILLFSIVDFGIYSFAQHTLQFATREGVRLALVGRTLTDPSGSQMTRVASIIKTIDDCATVAVDPTQLQISVYPVNPDYTDPTDWQSTQDAGGPGSYMRVRTRYQYKFITPLIAVLFPGGKIQITAQSTYRNERF